ncbi:hypothetical protein [Microbacterium sp. G2-8]|uniref:hypothetical protein n=1 Tax=Microbacterium sp. G2-8 TaxID=2842454 RepID=UPI001C8AC0C2|nr:hypothetical protein [Microbacterium sp. G2-8]
MSTATYRTGRGIRDALVSLTDTIRTALLPLAAGLAGWPVIESPNLAPGEVIYGDAVIYMHPRDAIRLRLPDTINGALAASLEWQHHEIDRAATEAKHRIDAMHTHTTNREGHTP